ncbi:fumarylacetoacetate hydrolase family protein [Dactylosporangium sp. CA-092794]|uniref:fumarylacetoacetate hydrolase family protein n=1 Tax=Dactylosporangium sp. CA-092794 TaxID=3239929 RepID=UPI003D921DF1
MRFATIREGGTLSGAVVHGRRVVKVDAGTAVEAFLRRDRLTELAEYDYDRVRLASVSPAPAHILCVGLNYRSHIEELGRPAPQYPAVFAKFASTLTGPGDDIVLPSISDHIDGEVELTVVIGRTVRREPVESAAGAIAGYTVANDLSLRDWQHRTSEALQGKVFDGSTPLGPVLVTPDELDVTDARLTFSVDGEVWQTGSTGDLLFRPAELVSYCSMFVTLRPGDLILTGTPAKTPAAGPSLAPGSTMVTTIDGIGSAINRTVADADGTSPA